MRRQVRAIGLTAALVAGAVVAVPGRQASPGTRPASPAATSAGRTATTPLAPTTFTTPPLVTTGYAAARPAGVTRAAYDFAAQHPEVLKYVPCYCGCEADGHPHNESCFVKARDGKGNVTTWDMHGYG